MKPVLGVLVATVLLGASLGTGTPPGSATTGREVSGTVTVFAASSLTEAFTKLGKQFERKYPGTDVRFNFLASSELATQIQQGAPFDAFASADDVNMQKVIDSGDVTASSPPSVIARNRLEIVVERGNPRNIKGLADLADPDLVVVVCGDAVPCGKYAAEAMRKAGVTVSPASKAESAKAVVTTVTTGEADAGVVYVTDVEAAGDSVGGVRIPTTENVIATYPQAVARDAPNEAGAKAWVQFVVSKKGQRTMRELGFLAPR